MPTAPFDHTIATRGTTATLYASDGVTVIGVTNVLIFNTQQVRLIGTSRGDAISCLFPTTQPVIPGQMIDAPYVGFSWFLLAKVLNMTSPWRTNPGTLVTMLGMPYFLNGQRQSTPPAGALNPYDEPIAVDTQGRPTVPTLADYTVRCGLSNTFDPLSNGVEGPLPSVGTFTAFCGLASPPQQGEQIRLPDGRQSTVANTNILYADGSAYAKQLILAIAAGTGFAPE